MALTRPAVQVAFRGGPLDGRETLFVLPLPPQFWVPVLRHEIGPGGISVSSMSGHRWLYALTETEHGNRYDLGGCA